MFNVGASIEMDVGFRNLQIVHETYVKVVTRLCQYKLVYGTILLSLVRNVVANMRIGLINLNVDSGLSSVCHGFMD